MPVQKIWLLETLGCHRIWNFCMVPMLHKLEDSNQQQQIWISLLRGWQRCLKATLQTSESVQPVFTHMFKQLCEPCVNVCVNMCVSIFINMCVNMWVKRCVDMCVYMCDNMFENVFEDMLINMCVNKCVNKCVSMCVNIYVDIVLICFYKYVTFL